MKPLESFYSYLITRKHVDLIGRKCENVEIFKICSKSLSWPVSTLTSSSFKNIDFWEGTGSMKQKKNPIKTKFHRIEEWKKWTFEGLWLNRLSDAYVLNKIKHTMYENVYEKYFGLFQNRVYFRVNLLRLHWENQNENVTIFQHKLQIKVTGNFCIPFFLTKIRGFQIFWIKISNFFNVNIQICYSYSISYTL